MALIFDVEGETVVVLSLAVSSDRANLPWRGSIGELPKVCRASAILARVLHPVGASPNFLMDEVLMKLP